MDDDTVRADAAAIQTSAASRAPLTASGYIVGDVIGRGGMGEVLAARDTRIDREVALKRLVADAPTADAVTRFLREARIQARLDHPAIVPVYELGTDTAGWPYFTMKRLAGVTLAARLADGGPIQPLLRAFVDVCLAVELAHTRGIVHRDLKPANIMLGNFGEVYVLDWGVARVLADPTPTQPLVHEIPTLDDGTRTGVLLGTPGYIAPETVEGQPAEPPVDVYALGSILFEILAGERLHAKIAALVRTLAEPQASPAQRRPDRAIAPELDAICVSALAPAAAERPTARELADRVQAYLDGDRDLEQRRLLAATELAGAHAALASDDRATAIRRAGRALALDPESDAAALVTALVVEPPEAIPAELEASLDAEARTATRARARRGIYAFAAILAFWVAVPFLQVRSWGWLLAFNAVIVALVTFAWRASHTGRIRIPYAMVGNLLLGVLATRIAGPFLLTPLVICGALLAFSADRWTMERPWALLAWAIATVMTPFALEWLDVFESTWSLDSTGFWTRSEIYELPSATVAAGSLIAANLVFVCAVGLYALGINRTAQTAARSLHVQAWHLKQLLPR